VLQIGTDCVYSGNLGSYDEKSEFDCSDIYGLSKVEGERQSKSLMILRTSIVGHELNSTASLLDWFIKREPNAKVNGFTNHFWNGVTTLAFARIVGGIINTGSFESGTRHILPADQVSKYQLLKEFQTAFGRSDISIEPYAHDTSINRTLSTIYPEKNSGFWSKAGYNEIPTVHEMVQEYALWAR
jgi:dTDP-4-dehydrorhamnose reductase